MSKLSAGLAFTFTPLLVAACSAGPTNDETTSNTGEAYSLISPPAGCHESIEVAGSCSASVWCDENNPTATYSLEMKDGDGTYNDFGAVAHNQSEWLSLGQNLNPYWTYRVCIHSQAFVGKSPHLTPATACTADIEPSGACPSSSSSGGGNTGGSGSSGGNSRI